MEFLVINSDYLKILSENYQDFFIEISDETKSKFLDYEKLYEGDKNVWKSIKHTFDIKEQTPETDDGSKNDNNNKTNKMTEKEEKTKSNYY